MNPEPKKVLIIDDEPQQTLFFSTLLEDHGFTTLTANSADEGLELLERNRPDVILLDLVMPRRTGVILFNKLRKSRIHRDVPVIIVTGIGNYFTEDYRDFFLQLKLKRPCAYLEKPVDPALLIRTVQQCARLGV